MAELSREEIAMNLRTLGVQVLTDLVELVSRDVARGRSVALPVVGVEEQVANPPESSEATAGVSYPASATFYNPDGSLKHIGELEGDYIAEALRANDWNVAKAAEATELGQATIYRKIKKYGIRLPRKPKASDDIGSSSQ